jgi:hypothetical protein
VNCHPYPYLLWEGKAVLTAPDSALLPQRWRKGTQHPQVAGRWREQVSRMRAGKKKGLCFSENLSLSSVYVSQK